MASRKKPAILYVIATLNLILGIPCLCCMSCAGFGTVAGEVMKPPAGAKADPNNPLTQMNEQLEEQQKFMVKEVAGYKAIQIGVIVVTILYSLALIISAIGLFMGQSWGRWMCIMACIVMILVGLASTVHNLFVVMPASKKFNEQQAAAAKPAASGEWYAAGSGVNIALSLAWQLGYPILAIALLMAGPAAGYFSNKGRRDNLDRPDEDWDRRGNDDIDDRDDDYDDRRRRDRDDFDR